jgi:tetratricopeptide (TPR) repeat protein
VEAAERSGAAAAASQLDADTVGRLAALGYVGGYAPQTDPSEEQLFGQPDGPDPKDHIKAYNAFLGARAFADEGAHAVAGRMLMKLVSVEPDNPTFRLLLAEQLRRLGKPAESATQLSAVLALQPENSLAMFRLGKVLGDLGRLDESIEYLTRAVDAMPEYADAHAFLGLGLQRRQDWAGAERHFRRALELNPRYEEAFVGLGATMYGQGRVSEAVAVWRRGMEIHAESRQLANNLAWCLATCSDAAIRDGDEAVRLAEQVCQGSDTENPAELDTLAAAYAEAGRLEEAVRTARRAVQAAEAQEQSGLAAAIRDRLERYASGQPYREEH